MSQTASDKSSSTKKSIATRDSTLKDLQERYNMDADIWKASKRGFPFNIPFNVIVAISLGIPLVVSFCVFDKNNTYLWKCYLFTLFLSVVAYFTSDKMIEQFKTSLEDNGLFGKDLNKAGQRETKPKV